MISNIILLYFVKKNFFLSILILLLMEFFIFIFFRHTQIIVDNYIFFKIIYSLIQYSAPIEIYFFLMSYYSKITSLSSDNSHFPNSTIVMIIIIIFCHCTQMYCLNNKHRVKLYSRLPSEQNNSTTPDRVFSSLLIIILASTTDRNTIFFVFFSDCKNNNEKKLPE